MGAPIERIARPGGESPAGQFGLCRAPLRESHASGIGPTAHPAVTGPGSDAGMAEALWTRALLWAECTPDLAISPGAPSRRNLVRSGSSHRTYQLLARHRFREIPVGSEGESGTHIGAVAPCGEKDEAGRR